MRVAIRATCGNANPRPQAHLVFDTNLGFSCSSCSSVREIARLALCKGPLILPRRLHALQERGGSLFRELAHAPCRGPLHQGVICLTPRFRGRFRTRCNENPASSVPLQSADSVPAGHRIVSHHNIVATSRKHAARTQRMAVIVLMQTKCGWFRSKYNQRQ